MDVSSAGKIQYENIKAGRLNLGLSSAATFTGSADVQSVNADISSASTVNINGKANEVKLMLQALQTLTDRILEVVL